MRQFANNSSNSASTTCRSLPRIAITMGDPAGIGPEVVLKAVAEEEIQRVCVPVIIGDAQLLAHTARTLDLQCGYDIVRKGEPIPDELSEHRNLSSRQHRWIYRTGHRVGRGRKSCGGYIEAAVDYAPPEALTRLRLLQLISALCFSAVTVFPVTRNFSRTLPAPKNMRWLLSQPTCALF